MRGNPRNRPTCPSTCAETRGTDPLVRRLRGNSRNRPVYPMAFRGATRMSGTSPEPDRRIDRNLFITVSGPP
ncbi:MAG: hypothetical protein ACOCPY_00295, partial [Halorubrum sp.]